MNSSARIAATSLNALAWLAKDLALAGEIQVSLLSAVVEKRIGMAAIFVSALALHRAVPESSVITLLFFGTAGIVIGGFVVEIGDMISYLCSRMK